MNDPSTLPLILVNVALGVLCFGCVIAVLVAVSLDVAERRRWRRSIPQGWPPNEPMARSTPIEPEQLASLPDCWPPQESEARA